MNILKTYQFPEPVIKRALKIANARHQELTKRYNHSFVNYNRETFTLKRRGTICGRKPKLAVPTKFLKGGQWLLQPKCSLIKRERILKSLVKKYGEYNSYVGCDLHDGNVGEWKGRYVVFDW
jgi:hypothetical protein